MGEDDFEPIPPPAPPWLAPLLASAFLIGLDWLLYSRVEPVRRATDLVLLQSPAAEEWLLLLASLAVGAAVLVGATAHLRPRVTHGVERRSYVFLAFSEGLSSTLLVAACATAIALENWFDGWIQAHHGLNFTSQVFRLEGAAVGGLQSALRPRALASFLDPLGIAHYTYGLILLAVGLPLWYAWRRDEAALRSTSRASLVLVAVALPFFLVFPVDPPSLALGGLDGPAASQPLLSRLLPDQEGAPGFLLAPNNGFPILHAAVASLAVGVHAFGRRWIEAAAIAPAALLVALAPLYLGEAWITAWTAGVGLGALAAWATRASTDKALAPR